MSLEIYAKHLAEKGRGPDDTLVHMSQDEVKSLNDLAMAHGGQLTINPHTGLPEAGFLSSLLPMVAGAALTGLSGGAINPLTAGMLVGGGSYLLNPKQGLMGGLMAGLGAYGGAGLGEALAQQGMEQAAGQKMLEGQVAENTAKMGTNLTPEALAKTGLQPGQYGYGLSGEMAGGDMMTKLTGPQYGAGMSTADLNAGLANQSITERLGTMGQGVKSLGTEGGFSSLYDKLGGGFKAASTAASALSPAIADSMKATPPPTPTADKDMGQRYSYSPGIAQPLPAPDVPTYDQMLTQQGNFGKQQNYYPNQGYTPISNDAAKNLYHFAGGGPVENMSNNAAIGANTMYPMANMSTSAFATPYQDPKSTNMLAGMNQSSGGTVDPMSGEPNMQGTRLAGGGVSYDPQTQTYASLGNATSSGETPFSSSYSNIGNPTNTGGGPGSTTSTSSGPAVGTGGYSGYASPVDAATAQQGTDSLVSLAMPFGIAMTVMDAINGQTTAPVSQGSVSGTSLGSLGPASEGPSSTSASASESSAPSDGGAPGMGGDARGGYLSQGRFDQRPHMATGGVAKYGFGGFLGDSLSRIGSAIGHIGKSDSGGDPNGWAHLEEMMGGKPKQQAMETAGYQYNPQTQQYQQMATGGISDAGYNLGGYSDGGRLLRGPGDGVSDSIPATIGHKQPARLADGEFVVPARIVSELGNGSTEAGARKLYAMMDRVQSARRQTVGKGRVAKNSRADKYLPA